MRYLEILDEAAYKPHRFNGTLPEFKQELTRYWGKLAPGSKKEGRKEFFFTPDGTEAGYFVTTSDENGVPAGGGRIARKTRKAKDVAPTTSAAEPVAPVTPVAEPAAKSGDALEAAHTLYRLMREYGQQYARWRNVTGDAKRATFEVRDWGEWEMPEGNYEDGEEEDYDWQVLSPKSSAILRSLVNKAKEANPGVTIDAQDEEKNWIVVHTYIV